MQDPMSRTRAFVEVDVFSANPYLGNPLAVVIDGERHRRRHDGARRPVRTGLSETTFLLAPTEPAADYRVRIFTQRGEIPFAGHPTLGSAHAWLEDGGVPDEQIESSRMRRWSGEISRSGGTLAFAAPAVQRSDDSRDYLAQLVAALNIDARQVVGHQ
ncbi:MAG: PhzF family phenazine biosynthesis protein [Thermomicrobiales bacterium]